MSSTELAAANRGARSFDLRTIGIALLMLISVIAVYVPWPVMTGEQYVYGADHVQLHARRMRFAREHLFGPQHTLPAWYPRELMGTPFRSNVQNFPWIPTRLIVLGLVDPEYALGAGAALSAALSAAFTFLLCGRLGLGGIASASAGWTFACAGFFASRILAGHLPLLEAYPALPALLWLTDRAISRTTTTATTTTARSPMRIDWSLIALGLTASCFALAGHPQLTVYSLGFAALYALTARPPRQVYRGMVCIVAMALGVGAAAFALYPMALLIGRSTRTLALDRAVNDLAMPVSRFAAMLFPWRDGWPASLHRSPGVEFHGYPSSAYFWDTVCYIGWAPLLATGGLAIVLVGRRTLPPRRAGVIAIIGVIALILALPLFQQIMSNVPGTFLRSPARLMYVVSFALAVALGAAVHVLLRAPVMRAAAFSVVVIGLALHAVDLTTHARHFVITPPIVREPFPTAQRDALLRVLRNGRMGIDYELNVPLNRVLDDVGFFDSIILAKPYRFVLDTGRFPETVNVQDMDAAQMELRTLRACGVRLLWTVGTRSDLKLLETRSAGDGSPAVNTYVVRNADARCRFFAADQIQFETEKQIHALLRTTSALDSQLLLAIEHKPATPLPDTTTRLAADVLYNRPGSDEMVATITTNQAGYARFLESWDPGWQATVDGAPAPVLAGNDVFITIPIPQGKHELRLIYRTPGATTGAIISIACLLLLCLLAMIRVTRVHGSASASEPITT